ncbi:MAG: ATP-binding protein [Gammaproteobacteria bacterium]|nr:ATP-binding protein [Gammaproteobacteria bacterium]
MAKDPWHFERPDYTARILLLLNSGPAQALTLFGPRRTGKTEFLLKDLAPLAEAQGHRVIYASFWQAPLSPLAVLIHALEQSLNNASFADRMRSAAVALAPKLKLSAPLPGATAEAEIDLANIQPHTSLDLLLYLDDLVGRAARNRRPTILLMDEVQELARSQGNASLIAALRTSLDKRSDRVRTLFTGSSRDGLASMFSARQAPFFHFATPIELPPLREPFIDHMIATFSKVSGRSPCREEWVRAFENLHCNPYFFRLLIEALLQLPDLAVASAVDAVRDRIAIELGYANAWLTLPPLHRGVARALASGRKHPYSKDFRSVLGIYAEEAPPSAAKVQAALKRLQRSGHVDIHTGDWTLVDPEFAAWVREHG